MSRKTYLLITFFLGLSLSFCTRETENFKDPEYDAERLATLYPLKKGAYITYRIDSIIPIRQGRALETRRYQIKDVVDTLVTDNLGRPAYRVYRYLNDSLAKGSWAPLGTYYVTPYPDKIEVTENNLRTTRLRLPLRLEYTWKGNAYLADGAYGFFNDVRFTEVSDWDFSYSSLGPEKVGKKNYDSVWTVLQFNEVADTTSIPPGLSSPHHRLYGVGYSEEKYVPRIGLVARELIMLENNPNQSDTATFDPYRTGFGVRMWLIDHN